MQNERVQRLLSVRIVAVWAKVAYVIAFVLIGLLLVRFVPVIGGVLQDVVQLTAIVYGSRVFRGRGELIEQPRPWWRMTAWPTASGWIGFSAVAGLLFNPLGQVLKVAGVDRFAWKGSAVELVSVTLFWGVVALLYLNSWDWLRRFNFSRPPKLSGSDPDVLARPKSRLS